MSHEEFLTKQIRTLLVAGSKYDEREANAAVVYAMEYRCTHPNASLQMLIDEAKFYLKRNHRPAPPPRTEPIKKARLPAWRQRN